MLTRIWAPSSASSYGVGQVPEVLADAHAQPDAKRRVDGTQRGRPAREEAPLVEQAVVGQKRPCDGRGAARRPRAAPRLMNSR